MCQESGGERERNHAHVPGQQCAPSVSAGGADAGLRHVVMSLMFDCDSVLTNLVIIFACRDYMCQGEGRGLCDTRR